MPERAIVTLDAGGCIVRWNSAAERITGLPARDIVGRSFAALFTAQGVGRLEHEAMLRTAAAQGECQQEGLLVTALYDRDHKLDGYALMLSAEPDVEREPDDERARQSQRMEVVGRLASGIAHDFNNLLTAIHGHAQFMIEDLPDNHPVRDDAEEILSSAERAAALTRQLLAFSRGQSIRQQIICMNDVVSSMEKLLRRVINENIQLETHLDPNLAMACADTGQIEQVLVNLVINARDAMPDGGTITVKTANAELADSYLNKREDVMPGDYVMLAVSDTGVGMDAETQSRVFEPFFTTKEAGRGTGLGLAQVQGIVKQAGGYIFIYSEPGRGTTVKIYLPNAVATKPQPEKDHLSRGEAILVIEDEPAIRTLTKRVLESRGYNVMLVGTASEAIRALSDERIKFALAITDLVLPDTHGEQVVDLIKRKRPNCKILLMSGYTAEDVRRENPKLASAEFMEKPFTPDQLSKKVRQLLGN